MLEDIIAGKGEFTGMPTSGASVYVFKEIAPHIKCADGTELSVQASSTHYCMPRVDRAPYTHVEVGYPTAVPPDTWAGYADGEYPDVGVYGYVPVELVRKYVEAHGGEALSDAERHQYAIDEVKWAEQHPDALGRPDNWREEL